MYSATSRDSIAAWFWSGSGGNALQQTHDLDLSDSYCLLHEVQGGACESRIAAALQEDS